MEEKKVKMNKKKNDLSETELNDVGSRVCVTPGIEEDGETPKSTNNIDKNKFVDTRRN